jgi:hypothetical protein
MELNFCIDFGFGATSGTLAAVVGAYSLGLKSKAEIWAVPTGLQVSVVWIEVKVGVRF